MASPLIVGIDVSKALLHVAFVAPGKTQATFLDTFPNEPTSFDTLAESLRKTLAQEGAESLHLILEPTGGYEQPFAHYAHRQGWALSLPNPAHVRHWAKSQGRRAKTDGLDARLLATFGADRPLPLWKPLPEAVATLDLLLQHLDALQTSLRQHLNRQHSLQARGVYRPPVSESLELVIQTLQQELAKTQAAIQAHQDKHTALRERAQQLQTVPGLGEKNVLFLQVTLERFYTLTDGQGTAKQLTAYLGLDPLVHQSGERNRYGPISRQGNADLRRRLFMGALGGVRGNNPLKVFYQRLLSRNKPKKVALTAAAHKIVAWAWAVFCNNTVFQPELALPRGGSS